MNIDSITSVLVQKALDTAWLRHQVISNNIANHNTPGFIPGRVNFESKISDLLKSNEKFVVDKNLKLDLDNLEPEIVQTDKVTTYLGSNVQLDQEMVQLAKNTMQYQALIEGLARYGELNKMAVRGGAN